jgi:hypothetical protein
MELRFPYDHPSVGASPSAPAVYQCRAPINFEPQFGQFTPANALPEAMFHPITPWPLVWMASSHAKSSN